MKRRVTVRDVAAAAGVSQATASRALAGHPSVDPARVRGVAAAAKELNYKANHVAKALRGQQTGTIGVVVPSISNPYFISVVEALERVLAESQRSLILCDARDDPATEAERIEVLQSRMVDGLIIIPVSQSESGHSLRAASAHRPVLQFDRFADDAGTDFVGTDNRDGVRQMVEHLRSRGCRTIAYVGSRPTTSVGSERLETFRALTSSTGDVDAGAASGTELLGEFTVDWGREAGRRLLAAGTLPDAIVCGADLLAVGVMSVLRDAGVSVPGDVQLVSFDDSPMAQITSPKLTSVRQPLEEMAREAIRLLDDSSAGDRSPRKVIVAPTLVVRESTGVELDRTRREAPSPSLEVPNEASAPAERST